MTCRLLNFVEKSLYHGVTYGTIEEIFFRYAVDPLLQATDPLIRDIVLTAYAARVRTGYYGNGNQIKVQGVTEALAAISKTIEMAGQKKAVYRSSKTHNLQIERCIEEGWRRQDPPAVPQLALPVTVPFHMAESAYATTSADQQAIGDLGLTGFYYLLRVGEYTKPRTTTLHGRHMRATRTIQFHIKDVGFFKD
jgi:hypothetical protein